MNGSVRALAADGLGHLYVGGVFSRAGTNACSNIARATLWQPSGGTPLALGLNFVPALTLTDAIGNSVRVDYINQFGPTDAWATLATVTLTNTTQLYFDTSAIGQPPRLWRIVPVP